MSRYWFADSPEQILAQMGLKIHPGKMRDLLDLANGDINVWYYLSTIIGEHKAFADEAVNFILGPLASNLKERGFSWKEKEQIISASAIVILIEGIAAGAVPKSIRRDFDALLIKRFNKEILDRETNYEMVWQNAFSGERVVRAINDPARELFYEILCEVLSATLEGPSITEIDAIIERIMSENPAQVEKAKADSRLVGWFIGQVTKASPSKLDPVLVRSRIEAKL